MGGDANVLDEHEVRYELIKRLKKFYHPPHGSLVRRSIDKFRDVFLSNLKN